MQNLILGYRSSTPPKISEAAAIVVDDAEHVVDVGVVAGALADLREIVLGPLELALLVVLTPEREELFRAVVHGASQRSPRRRAGSIPGMVGDGPTHDRDRG